MEKLNLVLLIRDMCQRWGVDYQWGVDKFSIKRGDINVSFKENFSMVFGKKKTRTNRMVELKIPFYISKRKKTLAILYFIAQGHKEFQDVKNLEIELMYRWTKRFAYTVK